MAHRDVRKETPEVIFELRKRAVALKQSGASHAHVARFLEVSVAASRRWWAMFKAQGHAGLVLGRRGRPKGHLRVLSKRQEKAIIQAITDKVPEQLKLPFSLWTRPAIRQFIEQRYGMRLPVRTLGHYLKRWGFTPQRPKKQAYEQQPAEVQRWLKQQYPSIAKRAKVEKADILWGDETGVSNQDHAGRGYAPRGQTPLVRGIAGRVTCSMISAIGNRGDMRFMIYKGALNVEMFIKFLARLIRSASKKIFLIVDNLRVHKAQAVAQWVEQRSQKIELFYLPAYSPELNADEYLNNSLKAKLRNKPRPTTQALLQSQISNVMRSTQNQRELVRRFFQHPNVAYAA